MSGDGFAVEVGLGFGPDLQADQLAGLAGFEVAVFEVDAAVLAGDAGLVGGRGEGLPQQGHRAGGTAPSSTRELPFLI
jgi:hypothetical protein